MSMTLRVIQKLNVYRILCNNINKPYIIDITPPNHYFIQNKPKQNPSKQGQVSLTRRSSYSTESPKPVTTAASREAPLNTKNSRT